MCTADNIDQLLAGQPDFVLDAIDNIHTKVRDNAEMCAGKQAGVDTQLAARPAIWFCKHL
jgi:tRNA A37 threonylcarbamoyladenosine dehydratase